jgi:hypothetical protein
MVDPSDVRRIVLDAARLVKTGEVVVFGSASLACVAAFEARPVSAAGREPCG